MLAEPPGHVCEPIATRVAGAGGLFSQRRDGFGGGPSNPEVVGVLPVSPIRGPPCLCPACGYAAQGSLSSWTDSPRH